MLLSLSIRDVVLIDRLDLGFERGLSVLTGETGAGKSILLDALGLAIGARADSGQVRHGASQAVVSALFAVPPDHAARRLAAGQGLAAEGELLLRRVLTTDGRSRSFVNDQPVSVGLLRQIGETLVEIEGQFEQHGLLDPATHRDLLDLSGGLAGRADEAADAWGRWRSAAAARAIAEAELVQARRDEEFLRHAVSELQALAPQPREEDELAQSRLLLQHGQKLAEALQAALAELGGERGVERAIGAAQRRLERIAEMAAGRLDPVLAALDRAASESGEAVALLARLAADLDSDPRRLEQIEERLFALRGLARKHGVAADALPQLAATLAAQLAALDDRGGGLARLAAEEAESRRHYVERAEALSRARVKAATRLDRSVARELPPLKLEKARFSTRLDRLDESQWGANGFDRVTFEVATNPGTPVGPLHRVASGGELSRFMLALKVALAAVQPVPTLVFDEVDSDVGGATAAAVGERLARLAGDVQILVVTHSPQVAAMGAHHWRVEKAALNGGGAARVATRVEKLDAAGRREEIARMLAGATVTEEARAAADRLIAAGALQ